MRGGEFWNIQVVTDEGQTGDAATVAVESQFFLKMDGVPNLPKIRQKQICELNYLNIQEVHTYSKLKELPSQVAEDTSA